MKRVALAVLLGLLLAAAHAGQADAGPLEAREAWERARTLAARPWYERVRALRSVRAATHVHDSLFVRALAAEASVLRAAQRVHAAAALEERAAAAVPAHDPDRAVRRATQARGLLEEHDREAARPPWEEAARIARAATPWRADEALEALSDICADEGRMADLRALALRAGAEEARASTRIRLWGAYGLAALRADLLPEAHQALARAEQAFAQAAKADPRETARAAKAWLDLDLRRRLRARR